MIATSWLPRTTNGFPNCVRSLRKSGSPRGCETRSPVTQTRSGSRSATQATARSVASRPRDRAPRWKSERWAIRNPTRSGGRPGISTSSTRRSSQPASNQLYASTAQAAMTRPTITTAMPHTLMTTSPATPSRWRYAAPRPGSPRGSRARRRARRRTSRARPRCGRGAAASTPEVREPERRRCDS